MPHFFRREILQKMSVPIFFVLATILFSLGYSPQISLVFITYSIFIFWVLRGDMVRVRTKARNKGDEPLSPLLITILVFAILVFLASRFMPFLRFGMAPLGYDTGFYIGSIKSLYQPLTPANSFLYQLFSPFSAAGFSPIFLFHSLYIFFQVSIVGALWFFASSLHTPRRKKIAVILVALFALSSIQFLAYWWAFAQQMLAASFLIGSIAFFLRRSLWALPFAVLTFLVHTPTGVALFFGVLIALVLYGIRVVVLRRFRDKQLERVFLVGALFFLVGLLAKWSDIHNLITVFEEYGIWLANVPTVQLNEFRGLFLVPDALRILLFGIFPFSLFTLLTPRTWGLEKMGRQSVRAGLLFLYGLVAFLGFVSFAPVIYQARFGIMLELVLLLFAAPALLQLVESFWSDRYGKGALLLLTMFFVFGLSLMVWQQDAMVRREELADIMSISDKVEHNATMLVTDSYYAPWLWGFFSWNTISPGYLGDTWSIDTWNIFWSTGSDAERATLLSNRGIDSLYLYVGDRQRTGLPFERFLRESNLFTRITPHVWKFHRDRLIAD